MKLCIFCSANEQIDPFFFEKTAELGRWAASQGHTIVYGGVGQGLMECVAKATKEAGGHTIGVVPRIIEEGRRTSQYVDEVIACQDLNDRKQLMLEESDVFIALPGGMGTLDEVFTVAAAATIGYHSKRVILYNLKDFWHPLIALLDSLQAQGLMRRPWQDYIAVASTLEELSGIISS